MFTKSFMCAALASLVLTFGAYSAEDYFSMPETDGGRADVVDQPSLAQNGTTSREFAMPETDGGRADVVDQPSLASNYTDPLDRATELRLSEPVND